MVSPAGNGGKSRLVLISLMLIRGIIIPDSIYAGISEVMVLSIFETSEFRNELGIAIDGLVFVSASAKVTINFIFLDF